MIEMSVNLRTDQGQALYLLRKSESQGALKILNQKGARVAFFRCLVAFNAYLLQNFGLIIGFWHDF